ncbi:MAG: chaperone modulator CbpM [Gammaproteobacteria bacterium]
MENFIVIDDKSRLTLKEFCFALSTTEDTVAAMVEHAVIHPAGARREEWYFNADCLRRGRIAASFYHELEVNMPGVSLALTLIDEIQALKKAIK